MSRARFAVLIALALAPFPPAPLRAQNAPLSALPARGAAQADDLIPIQPAAGPQLMQTTVQAILAAGGGGTATGISLPGFSCAGSPTIACTVDAAADAVYAGPCGGAPPHRPSGRCAQPTCRPAA